MLMILSLENSHEEIASTFLRYMRRISYCVVSDIFLADEIRCNAFF